MILIILLVTNLYAASMGIPDSDTAILFELLSTTASQLNELEQLVSNTEKYTKRMEEYNQIAQDHYFRALRVVNWVEGMVELGQLRPKDLRELNQAIRELRSQLTDMKELYHEYENIFIDQKSLEMQLESVDRKIEFKKDKQVADFQLGRSQSRGTVKTMTKLTAQNTGLINSQLVKIHKTQSQIALSQAKYQKLQAQDKLNEMTQREQYYELNSQGTSLRRKSINGKNR